MIEGVIIVGVITDGGGGGVIMTCHGMGGCLIEQELGR